MPLCEPCTHGQQAYFLVGDLTRELAIVGTERSRGFREELLAKVSYRAHQERAEHVVTTEKSLEMVRR
jgi:hypothetical protein